MAFVLPWTINKLVSTNINNSDQVVGTFSNVSLKVNGATEMSGAVVTGNLGIGKSPTVPLDVSGNANISGKLTVTDGSFNGNVNFGFLPTCSATPTLSTQLITKAYGDATYGTPAGVATLAGINNFTGTNTYNTNLPSSILTPTISSELITKAYGDSTYSLSSGTAQLAVNNVFVADNSFNGNVNFAFFPTCSVATATLGTQLINRQFADSRYVRPNTNNTFTNNNTFNTFLPTSTLTPTTSTQLTTKAYVDTKASLPSPLVINYNSSKNCFYGGSNALTTQIGGAGTNLKNIAIGNNAMTDASNSAIENTFFGDNAGQFLTTGFGNYCCGVLSAQSLTTGYENISIGNSSMVYSTVAAQNVCMGIRSGQYLNGVENFALGLQALGGATTSNYCVAIGVNALLGQSTSSGTVGIGRYALSGGNTQDSVGIGYFCGVQFQSGSNFNTLIGAYTMWEYIIQPQYCTAIGYSAGANQNGNGVSNTYVGAYSLTSAVNPSYCTLLGANTNCTGNYSNSTCIGYQSVITGNNQIILGTSTETTYPMGNMIIPTGTFDAQGIDTVTPKNNAIKELICYPRLSTESNARTNSVHISGYNTAPLLAGGTGITIYGPSNLPLITSSTNNPSGLTIIGSNNFDSITATSPFFGIRCLGNSNFSGANIEMSSMFIIGDGTGFGGGATPSSIFSATFIGSPGINIATSVPINNVYALCTDQSITGSNQGIIGKSSIDLTINGNTTLPNTVLIQSELKVQSIQTTTGAGTLNIGNSDATTDLSGTVLINGVQKVNGYTNLSGTTNLSLPLSEVYFVTGTADATINLPALSVVLEGTSIVIVKNSASNTVTINPNGTNAFRFTGSNASTSTSPLEMVGRWTTVTLSVSQGNVWNILNAEGFQTARNALITAATTVAFPFFRVYSIGTLTASTTITLPVASLSLLGETITFRRSVASAFTVISSQSVYPVNNTFTTTTTLLGTTQVLVEITCLLRVSPSTYSWFIMRQT